MKEYYYTIHLLHVLATHATIFSEVHYKGQRYAPPWWWPHGWPKQVGGIRCA